MVSGQEGLCVLHPVSEVSQFLLLACSGMHIALKTLAFCCLCLCFYWFVVVVFNLCGIFMFSFNQVTSHLFPPGKNQRQNCSVTVALLGSDFGARIEKFVSFTFQE